MNLEIYDMISQPGYSNMDRSYFDSMIHAVPEAKVIKHREIFILDRCKDKRVINFGSTKGRLHSEIAKVAKLAYGIDKSGTPDLKVDLDDEFYSLAKLPIADMLVCGEVIEHLSNPGRFLSRVKAQMSHYLFLGDSLPELIISVPNAMGESNKAHMKRGYENVNADHVAWYSYHTLKTLVQRVGFKVKEFYWYGRGDPGFTEGLIFVVN